MAAALDAVHERVDALNARLDQMLHANREHMAWLEDQLDQVAHREPAEYLNPEDYRGY
jgi:bacterioferritin (cytochrome b1)